MAGSKPITVLDLWVRTAVWLVLVVGGLSVLAGTVVFSPPHVIVAVAIGLVVSWVVWGIFASHYWGISRHLARHLGPVRADEGAVLTHPVLTRDRVSLQRALDRLHLADDRYPVFGVAEYSTLLGVMQSNPVPIPVQRDSLPAGRGRTLSCATNALYLLRHQGRPFCALVHTGTGVPYGGKARRRTELEVFAPTEAEARAALTVILDVSQEENIYRGAVVTLEAVKDAEERYAVAFHDLPAVDRDAIVLPEGLLRAIERNVFGLLARREALRQAGQSTRHGLLLHGAPGTGKTLVTKYLAGQAGCTVVILQGRHMALLREACQLARLLAPTLLVLEDVDLVARDRRVNRNSNVLHDLLEEMDGLGPRSDCIFLLTTNRPETLERALAARPGRIDQAIAFPLPGREERRRLFARFGRGLDLSAVDLEPLLDRTDGASPAFLQEVFRRAALLAADRAEPGRPLRVLPADVEEALREILELGGELTQNILGFPRRRQPA